jgi:hypothetical protein
MRLAFLLAVVSALAVPSQAPAPAAHDLPVLEDGAIAAGWKDLGWATHELTPGQPARVDFSGSGGWIFLHPQLKPDFAGLLVRLRAPAGFGDFLEFTLDSRRGGVFPHVRPSAAMRAEEPDGWTTFWVPMTALDPDKAPFDRLILRAMSAVSQERVEIARVAFSNTAPRAQVEQLERLAPVRKMTAKLDCRQTHPISPLIYGVVSGDPSAAAEVSATAYRWGGNTTTRYNWKLDAWNTGNDYFFRNVKSDKPRSDWKSFVENAKSERRKVAFTIPMIGWTAKDANACGFPTSRFPEQAATDPYRPDCGNGVGRDNNPLPPGPPDLTSIPVDTSWTEQWTRGLRETDGGSGTLAMYMLDNEPTLWDKTHRDVHPEPVTYEELLQRTLDTSAAIRKADPKARIAGFTGWGYLSMLETGEDHGKGRFYIPARLKHGGTVLMPWWLEQLQKHDRESKVRTVDYVDMHFYPQGSNIGIGAGGGTDPETSMRRIRSVRGLWDPSYKDESWIDTQVMLIPRMRRYIAEKYPGLGIVIGEYNFGAEKHISGALALGEALGRFGALGIDGAFYFAWPEKGSLASWAFRAYRNYDGKGAAFGAESVAVAGLERDPLASVFASRTADGKLVLVALNSDPDKSLDLSIDADLCGPAGIGRVFTLAGADGLQPQALRAGPSQVRLQPWSMSVVEFKAAARQ